MISSQSWLNFLPLDFMFRSPDFLDDARHLAAIKEDTFRAAVDAFRSATGFLDPGGMVDLLQKAGLEDEPQREAVLGFLHNLTPDLGSSVSQQLAGMTIDDKTSAMRRQLEAQNFEDVEVVVDRATQLLEPIPALQLQAKAEALSNATGPSYVAHHFITDVRPVFNETRTEVEGLFPITTLKLRLSTPNGDADHEVTLSEEQLVALCESVEIARQKVDVLKTTLLRGKFTIPRVRMVSDASAAGEL